LSQNGETKNDSPVLFVTFNKMGIYTEYTYFWFVKTSTQHYSILFNQCPEIDFHRNITLCRLLLQMW